VHALFQQRVVSGDALLEQGVQGPGPLLLRGDFARGGLASAGLAVTRPGTIHRTLPTLGAVRFILASDDRMPA
jgi:hypothetical protein